MLHYLRIREWQDLVSQLRRVAKDIGLSPPEPLPDGSTPTGCTRRCWPGCSRTSACATRVAGTTSGRAGARFVLWPGLGPGQAAARVGRRRGAGRDLTAVGRVAAQVAARMGRAARRASGLAHATASRTGRPQRGAVMAYERVTLYGLPLVPSAGWRTARSTRACRGTCSSGTPSSRANGRRITRSSVTTRAGSRRWRQLEARTRRRNLLADEQARYDFFDARVPRALCLRRHFDRWWKRTRRDRPDLLSLDDDALLARGTDADRCGGLPDYLVRR